MAPGSKFGRGQVLQTCAILQKQLLRTIWDIMNIDVSGFSTSPDIGLVYGTLLLSGSVGDDEFVQKATGIRRMLTNPLDISLVSDAVMSERYAEIAKRNGCAMYKAFCLYLYMRNMITQILECDHKNIKVSRDPDTQSRINLMFNF